jgi:NOL1/NOP2/sun family putative RNA methylase
MAGRDLPDLAAATAWPAGFPDRLGEIFPAELLPRIVEALATPRQVGLRVNTLLTSVPAVTQRLHEAGIVVQPLAWQPSGLIAEAVSRAQLVESPLVNDGSLYIQGPSSQFVSLLLAPQPGETVLDLAAAPGGKTSHLAALMENRGVLSAVEPVRPRFFRLQANLKRLGVGIAKTYLMDGRAVPRKTGPRFDRVLLDAPCSGEARFSPHQPAALATWSERKIAECSRKQAGLIRAAFDSLRPGGRMLYCTCSFAPEENERVVARLLKDRPDAVLETPGEIPFETLDGLREFRGEVFGETVQRTRRIVPSPVMEGLFVALVRNDAG